MIIPSSECLITIQIYFVLCIFRSQMRTMVLESLTYIYLQNYPKKMAQFSVGKSSSTMVRIWGREKLSGIE